MEKEVFIVKWHILDYSGRRCGNGFMFQNEQVFKCEKLTQWIRWGKFLIRYRDILWFSGNSQKIDSNPTLDYLEFIFNKFLIDKPLIEFCKTSENFTEEHKKRYYYSRIKNLSKKELDLITDSEIEKFLNS